MTPDPRWLARCARSALRADRGWCDGRLVWLESVADNRRDCITTFGQVAWDRAYEAAGTVGAGR